jgi:hypothetical protein
MDQVKWTNFRHSPFRHSPYRAVHIMHHHTTQFILLSLSITTSQFHIAHIVPYQFHTHCHIVTSIVTLSHLSHCHIVTHFTLSHCHTVTLLHCPLSHCHTITHCHTVALSHCHTVTLSHCHILLSLMCTCNQLLTFFLRHPTLFLL